MSDQPEQPNPYAARNHENPHNMGKNDIYAVADLLGQVSSSLGKIDEQNVGGRNPHIQARKIDPKAVLKTMIPATQAAQPTQVSAPPQVAQQIEIPPQSPPAPVVQPADSEHIQSLERRVLQLEKIVESYKKVTKFKRGISYTVNTAKISGEFKDPIDIIDIITTELAKQTKSITLKLNDKNKD
ncbi:MAG: hypothetical protein EBY39_07955 [Flavobacteriia bacterium]|nr:hypothetical protein [Flavobacteriia bacterium]